MKECLVLATLKRASFSLSKALSSSRSIRLGYLFGAAKDHRVAFVKNKNFLSREEL